MVSVSQSLEMSKMSLDELRTVSFVENQRIAAFEDEDVDDEEIEDDDEDLDDDDDDLDDDDVVLAVDLDDFDDDDDLGGDDHAARAWR